MASHNSGTKRPHSPDGGADESQNKRPRFDESAPSAAAPVDRSQNKRPRFDESAPSAAAPVDRVAQEEAQMWEDRMRERAQEEHSKRSEHRSSSSRRESEHARSSSSHHHRDDTRREEGRRHESNHGRDGEHRRERDREREGDSRREHRGRDERRDDDRRARDRDDARRDDRRDGHRDDRRHDRRDEERRTSEAPRRRSRSRERDTASQSRGGDAAAGRDHGADKELVPRSQANMLDQGESMESNVNSRVSFEEQCAAIDWANERNMRLLNDTFFKHNDLIQQNSQEQKEFFEFLEKYNSFRLSAAFRRQAAGRGLDLPDDGYVPLEELQARAQEDERKKKEGHSADRSEAAAPVLSIPKVYDRRYRINCRVHTDPLPTVLLSRQEITPAVLEDFRQCLRLFEDYRQKKSFQKISKIFNDKKNLPIAAYHEQVVGSVASHPVVIVAGDTGCGKSTQVPQYLLYAGHERIACTQPRRIAAMSLARRLSYETMNEYGSSIGYQIRFQAAKTALTRVIFLTEGLLLRQAQNDSTLKNYSVLVLDEVHERHLFGDFLLGICKLLLERRPDLKIVLMSATINVNLFSTYFNEAPIIQVPGRLFPITVEYWPIDTSVLKDDPVFKEEGGRRKVVIPKDIINTAPYIRLLERVDERFPPSERGDMLIFLSGINEIRSVAEALQPYANNTHRWIILCLHSTLSVEEQDKVFDIAPDGVRKCILSTNIAETSVTIDGIRFVADSGKVKEMVYDATTRMKSLQECWISRASAEQRKGRAGRTGPGICFRLYSKQEYTTMVDYPVPEIQRTPLETLCLNIKSLNMGNPRMFPFIEMPSSDALEAAMVSLRQQQAVTDDPTEKITPLGMVLAKLPVDIPLGKMLVLGTIFDLIDPVLTMAAALTVQSPFVHVSEANKELHSARHQFDSDHGDPFTLLTLFDEWIRIKGDRTQHSGKWCRRHGVEESRLYELLKLKEQFGEILLDSGLLEAEGGEVVDAEIEVREEFRKKRHTRIQPRDHKKLAVNRKQLQELQMEKERKRGRRVLRLQTEDAPAEVEEEPEDDGLDVRDLDFQLSYNLHELMDKSNRDFSVRDINIIKTIVFSGLYPNVAVQDEGNTNRPDSDAVFHTQSKHFVIPHPTSVFHKNMERLDPQQVLAYVSLLETNKPYLMSSTKGPGLHLLLIFSRTIDTNADCRRLVIDNWLDVRVPDQETAEAMIIHAVTLRKNIEDVLRVKLAQKRGKDEVAAVHVDSVMASVATLTQPPEWVALLPAFLREIYTTHAQTPICTQEALGTRLAVYLETKVEFTINRVKATEQDSLFVMKDEGDKGLPAGESADAMQKLEALTKDDLEERKGGAAVLPFLRYNSLREGAESTGFTKHMRKKWHCKACNKDFMFTFEDVQEHNKKEHPRPGAAVPAVAPPIGEPPTGESASAAAAATAPDGDAPMPDVSRDSEGEEKEGEDAASKASTAAQQRLYVPAAVASTARSSYECEACGKTFLFTAMDVLRHRRSHGAVTTTEGQA